MIATLVTTATVLGLGLIAYMIYVCRTANS
jgi:hypothetical protein